MSKRDILFFLAGGEFFHTLSHIILPFFFQLPVQIDHLEFTWAMNVGAILINAILTVLLLVWALRTKK